MKYLRGKTVSATIDMAYANSKYNTKKSTINKKWVRFLKNRKLFDEYMVYLAGHEAVGVEPRSYRHVANICRNMSDRKYEMKGGKTVRVDWMKVFEDFADENIKWYHFRQRFLYMVNGGYK